MTSRERMTAALQGSECDHLPWAPELNAAFVQRVLWGENIEPERRYVEACKRIGADCLLAASPVTEVMNKVETETVTDGNSTIRIWRTPSGELRSREEKRNAAETTFEVEHKIKTAEDLAAYRFVVEHTEVVASEPGTVERTIKLLGEDGIISLTGPATPIMHLLMTDLRAPTMHYLLADHEAEVADLFKVMHERNVRAYRIIADAPGQVVRPFEDTSTSLLSPGMFRRHCQPYLREYAEIVQAKGKLFVPHLCGLLRKLLADLRETGLNGIEAVTPPETGDTPLSLAREALGEKLVLVGGIDPTWFCDLTPTEMRDRLDQILSSLGDGRYTMLGNEEISVRANVETVLEVPKVLEEVGPVPLR